VLRSDNRQPTTNGKHEATAPSSPLGGLPLNGLGRRTLSLAFLSPEVVQAIIAGRLPRGIGMTGLADLPASWNAQHAALGI
jgi:hypothetical protein